VLKPISRETGLRNLEHNVVENAVQKLVDGVYNDLFQRTNLGLRGTATLESYTNLGKTANDPITELVIHVFGASGGKQEAGGR